MPVMLQLRFSADTKIHESKWAKLELDNIQRMINYIYPHTYSWKDTASQQANKLSGIAANQILLLLELKLTRGHSRNLNFLHCHISLSLQNHLLFHKKTKACKNLCTRTHIFLIVKSLIWVIKKRELMPWSIACHSLTPGGSNYYEE